MSNFTLTVDDFDPILRYANYEVWQTPNPQDNPTWWNATQDVTNSPWNQATYHNTTAKGADSEASLTFTGNKVAIYGAAGGQPQFEVKIDGKAVTADPPSNSNEGRTLLFSQDVQYDKHELSITNNGDWLLLDSIEVGMVLGAEGAELKNTTVDDRDTSVLKFDGEWTQQEGENFFDKTSIWTGGKGGSVSFNFSGSAVWVYGDQVNDHGEYDVFLNDTQVGTYNGRSGCGGGYAKHCEKLHGLAFFAGPLPAGQHEVRIVNGGPDSGIKTFFDLDYVEYTTPSEYASGGANTTAGAAPGGQGASGSPSAPAPSGSSSSGPGAGSNNSAATGLATGSGTLALVLGAYVLRLLM